MQLEEEQQDPELSLDPHQLEAAKFLVSNPRTLLALPMGTGKTRCLILADQNIRHNIAQRNLPVTPTLVLCPKSAFLQWAKEFRKWWPESYESYEEPIVYIRGPKHVRAELWRKTHTRFIIATYRAVLFDRDIMPRNWTTVIMDEAHKARSRKTKTFEALKWLDSTAWFCVTGTPASRGPQDMWGFLHLQRRKHYSSYWKFVNRWCIVDDGSWGKEILGPKEPTRFKEMLAKQDMFFISRKDLSKYLPPKRRNCIPVEMTPIQERMYREMETELYTMTESGELLVASTVLSKITRLRQLLVCPQILDDECPEVGGAVEYVLDCLDENLHTVIFVPFTDAIAPIKTAIFKRFPNTTVEYLKGGMEPEEVAQRVETFKVTQGVMICSIAFATSFDLETSSLGIFVGRDFDPDTNYQAEDRLARRNSKGLVTIQYPIYENTYDNESIGILDKKRANVSPFLQTPEGLRAFLNPKVTS